ncbi:MAG: hypothetical protein MJ152_02995, partial [Clostridia bacterium]|nr:hypothetical protein [Clostridia bacterium]
MYAQVIVDISNDAVDRVFDYIALEDTSVGMRVKVPFANRTVLGYVIGLKDTTTCEISKIKSIIKNLESVPKLKPEILDLCFYLSRHFFLRLSDCIKLALPSCVRLGTQHEQIAYNVQPIMDLETCINILGKRAKKQVEAITYLYEHGEASFSILVETFGRQAINSLVEKGMVNKVGYRQMRNPNETAEKEEKKTLTVQQKNAVDQ